ncbi:MAG: hypothetical protein ACREC9_15690 [Methylocella sp.]
MTIIADFAHHTFTRGDLVVGLSRNQFLIIAVLLAARGPLRREDLADLLYGDDQDGGPLWAFSNIGVLIHKMRHGYRCRGNFYQGCLPRLGLAIAGGTKGRAGYRISDDAALFAGVEMQ